MHSSAPASHVYFCRARKFQNMESSFTIPNMLPSMLSSMLPCSFKDIGSMLTMSSCGEMKFMNALQEIGITQYIEKAKRKERMTGENREDMKKNLVRIETYLGSQAGVVVEWVCLGVIWGGQQIGWW